MTKYISDYKMNLIDPHEMSEEELMKFKSDLRTIMILLKCSGQEEEMRKAIHDKKWMKKMGREAELFSNVYFGIELQERDKEEEKTMKHTLAIVIEKEAEQRAQVMAKEIAEKMVEEKSDEMSKQIIGQLARKMIEDGLSEELVAKYANLTINDIKKLKS